MGIWRSLEHRAMDARGVAHAEFREMDEVDAVARVGLGSGLARNGRVTRGCAWRVVAAPYTIWVQRSFDAAVCQKTDFRKNGLFNCSFASKRPQSAR